MGTLAPRLARLERRWPDPQAVERAGAQALGQWLDWAWTFAIDPTPPDLRLAGWRSLIERARLSPAGVVDGVRLGLRRFGLDAAEAREVVREPSDVPPFLCLLAVRMAYLGRGIDIDFATASVEAETLLQHWEPALGE